LARAGRGIACGARGEALGALRAFESLALIGLAKWAQAAEMGADALALLPRGTLWWCKLAEKLFNVFPFIGQSQRFERLVRDFAEIKPEPGALSAYVCADGYQMMMFSFLGARDEVGRCLARIRSFGASVLEKDEYARGCFSLFYGWSVNSLEPDPFLAMSLGEESVRDFVRTQLPRGVCQAKALLGSARAALGDFLGGEKDLRESQAIAEDARDVFFRVNAQAYLIVVLIDAGIVIHFDEIERLAIVVRDANLHVGYVAVAHIALAYAWLARGRAVEAEAEARTSLDLFAVSPPYRLMSRVVLIRALRAQGRAEEAAALAREGLDALAKLGGTGWTEVPFRIAAAETLHEAGDFDGARASLREALRQIELRAGKIPDSLWRERYLTLRPENIRASELSRAWLEVGS
jgi:tetratricopeptide (TPR) repeat protein